MIPVAGETMRSSIKLGGTSSNGYFGGSTLNFFSPTLSLINAVHIQPCATEKVRTIGSSGIQCPVNRAPDSGYKEAG
jgi:hypothetical protein